MVVDRLGRRPVAIAGTVSVMLGLALMAAGFLGRSNQYGVSGAWLAMLTILGMCIFRIGFSFSLSPLPYIMTAELFPQEVRAVGTGICWMVNWAANCLVCQTFPMLAEAMSHSMSSAAANAIIFMVYFAFTCVALAFVVVFLPETKGLRLASVKA